MVITPVTTRILCAALLSLAATPLLADCRITVNFAFGSAVVPSQYYPDLDKVGAALRSGNVQIIGHTDLVGSPSANLALSQRRANAVRDRLIAAGVPASRIVMVQGDGEANPVVATTAANAQNRRAEVFIDDCDGSVYGAPAVGGLSTEAGVAALIGAGVLGLIASGGSSSSTTGSR